MQRCDPSYKSQPGYNPLLLAIYDVWGLKFMAQAANKKGDVEAATIRSTVSTGSSVRRSQTVEVEVTGSAALFSDCSASLTHARTLSSVPRRGAGRVRSRARAGAGALADAVGRIAAAQSVVRATAQRVRSWQALGVVGEGVRGECSPNGGAERLRGLPDCLTALRSLGPFTTCGRRDGPPEPRRSSGLRDLLPRRRRVAPSDHHDPGSVVRSSTHRGETPFGPK